MYVFVHDSQSHVFFDSSSHTLLEKINIGFYYLASYEKRLKKRKKKTNKKNY